MNFLRRSVQNLLNRIKGKNYPIDPEMSIKSLAIIVFRRLFWALRGAVRLVVFQRRIGLVFIGSGVEIRNHNLLDLGVGVTLDTGVFLDCLSTGGVHLGDGVSLGRHSILRCTGSFSKLGEGVWIGPGSSMDAFAFIGAAGGVRIGQNVIMGQHISFHAENHQISDIDQLIKNQGTTRLGIIIGDNCWIGSNVTFLDGCNIGSGCVIGAGSVVRGSIPNNSIVAGVPGKVIRTRGVDSN